MSLQIYYYYYQVNDKVVIVYNSCFTCQVKKNYLIIQCRFAGLQKKKNNNNDQTYSNVGLVNIFKDSVMFETTFFIIGRTFILVYGETIFI